MTWMTEQERLITRRAAIGRVGALLGGVTLIGGTTLLEACSKEQPRAEATANGAGAFSAQDIAFLDEVADTILPTTAKSPGAKAAQTGAFMALMVTDTYDPGNQQVFRDGMKKLDDACTAAHKHGFMQASAEERLAVLTQLDKDAKAYMDARAAAGAAAAKSAIAARPTEQAPQGEAAKDAGPKGKESDKQLQGDQRQEAATGQGTANPAPAVTADAPPHYFRMMKELAMLGFFTSEIGYTKAMRYQETPGRFDPCVPYKAGETAWAAHA